MGGAFGKLKVSLLQAFQFLKPDVVFSSCEFYLFINVRSLFLLGKTCGQGYYQTNIQSQTLRHTLSLFILKIYGHLQ